MSRFRTILLAAVMLAVLFHGYAAASIVSCANGHRSETAAVQLSHFQSHDHSNDQAAHVDAHADEIASTEPEGAHKCGTCGACHAVALTSAPHASATHLLPDADLAEPVSALATRSPHVLDRPPRG